MKHTVKRSGFVFIAFTFLFVFSFSTPVHAQNENQNVLNVVREFFAAIGKSDSIAFNKVFMPDAHMYVARPVNDSIQYLSRAAVGRSIFKPGRALRETMREKGVKVEVHQNIAMAWVPYEFHVNNNFSHCGVDVFTFMKTKEGWKIALIAYTVEKDGCKDW